MAVKQLQYISERHGGVGCDRLAVDDVPDFRVDVCQIQRCCQRQPLQDIAGLRIGGSGHGSNHAALALAFFQFGIGDGGGDGIGIGIAVADDVHVLFHGSS